MGTSFFLLRACFATQEQPFIMKSVKKQGSSDIEAGVQIHQARIVNGTVHAKHST